MICTIASIKGGTGKSTIATNLSVLCAQNNFTTLLVDADKQRSSFDFISVRSAESLSPSVTSCVVYGKTAGMEISKLSKNFDITIVDVGGTDSTTLRSCLLSTNILLIPILPSQFDVWSLEQMNSLLEEVVQIKNEIQVLTILNKKDTNPNVGIADDFLNILSDFTCIKEINYFLGYRIAFRHALTLGKSVGEMCKKDIKAITEMEKIFKGVFLNEEETSRKQC
jgi:chromosome partitioning protein